MKLFYVGPFSFPNGGAAAKRILNNCKALRKVGIDVTVISGQTVDSFTPRVFEYEGFPVHSTSERLYEHLPRLVKHFHYAKMGIETINYLIRNSLIPDVIVVYSGYTPYLFRFTKWARVLGIQIIFDVVEWYEPKNLLGYLSPYQINIEFALRFLAPRVDRVIVISDYLRDYYLNLQCAVLIVPPLIDARHTSFSIRGRVKSSVLSLIYAGSPGNKDELVQLLRSVQYVNRNGVCLVLSLVGLDDFDFERCVLDSDITEYSDYLNNVGIVSHSFAVELVRSSDFSVFLRRDCRNSNAGFPTKFGESLSVGTPVICNITSDIGRYLQDGINGYKCASLSVEDICECLSRACNISDLELECMRRDARLCAEKFFDYGNYSLPLLNFIQGS